MNGFAFKVNPRAILLVLLVITMSATSLIVIYKHSSKKENDEKIIENISIEDSTYYI